MSRMKDFALQSNADARGAPARSGSEDGRASHTGAVRGGASLDAPPSTNRGGTNEAPLASLERLHIVVTDSGELKTVAVRVPAAGHVAVVDTLRFTLGEETWSKTAGISLIDDESFVYEASRHLEAIFGFGVTSNLNRPRDFYLNAWELGEGYGYVAMGGLRQRGTMLVNLTGQGCLAAKPGWESRLYEFLNSVAR